MSQTSQAGWSAALARMRHAMLKAISCGPPLGEQGQQRAGHPAQDVPCNAAGPNDACTSVPHTGTAAHSSTAAGTKAPRSASLSCQQQQQQQQQEQQQQEQQQPGAAAQHGKPSVLAATLMAREANHKAMQAQATGTGRPAPHASASHGGASRAHQSPHLPASAPVFPPPAHQPACSNGGSSAQPCQLLAAMDIPVHSMSSSGLPDSTYSTPGAGTPGPGSMHGHRTVDGTRDQPPRGRSFVQGQRQQPPPAMPARPRSVSACGSGGPPRSPEGSPPGICKLPSTGQLRSNPSSRASSPRTRSRLLFVGSGSDSLRGEGGEGRGSSRQSPGGRDAPGLPRASSARSAAHSTRSQSPQAHDAEGDPAHVWLHERQPAGSSPSSPGTGYQPARPQQLQLLHSPQHPLQVQPWPGAQRSPGAAVAAAAAAAASAAAAAAGTQGLGPHFGCVEVSNGQKHAQHAGMATGGPLSQLPAAQHALHAHQEGHQAGMALGHRTKLSLAGIREKLQEGEEGDAPLPTSSGPLPTSSTLYTAREHPFSNTSSTGTAPGENEGLAPSLQQPHQQGCQPPQQACQQAPLSGQLSGVSTHSRGPGCSAASSATSNALPSTIQVLTSEANACEGAASSTQLPSPGRPPALARHASLPHPPPLPHALPQHPGFVPALSMGDLGRSTAHGAGLAGLPASRASSPGPTPFPAGLPAPRASSPGPTPFPAGLPAPRGSSPGPAPSPAGVPLVSAAAGWSPVRGGATGARPPTPPVAPGFPLMAPAWQQPGHLGWGAAGPKDHALSQALPIMPGFMMNGSQDKEVELPAEEPASAPMPRVTPHSSTRRSLRISSTQLQEAVRLMLREQQHHQQVLRAQVQAAAPPRGPPPAPSPQSMLPVASLDAELCVLNVAKLESELIGLVLIGRGGGGAVFRAIWQGAQVAVKFMLGKTPASVSLGALEAVLAASVNHPHVVQTYGFDVAKVRDSSFVMQATDVEVCGGPQQQYMMPSSGSSSGSYAARAPQGFGSQVVASIMKELQWEKARMQALVAGGAAANTPSGFTSGGANSNGSTLAAAGVVVTSVVSDQHAGAASNSSGMSPSQQHTPNSRQPVDVMSSFHSDEGFGEPVEVKPVDCWTMRDVLAALKAQPGMYLTHIIMEYCDRGTLLGALQRGVFSLGGSSGDTSRFNERVVLRAALRTARDVVHGMQHLHTSGIIHGDLKPGNVLLRGSRTDRRGFVAKVADFGLSKVVTSDGPLEMHHWSTVTHMAPEVVHGTWCKASDVYSFGVLLWQLICGEPQPFKHLTVPQVVSGVSQGWLQLPWPRTCHPAIAKLGLACMAHNPSMRPNFQEIAQVLLAIEQNMRDELRYAVRA